MSAALRPFLVASDGGDAAPATRVAAIAAAAAEAVDRDGAFPTAAVDAMRQERLLSGLLPVSVGGRGLSVSAVASECCTLGAACASSAMIYAMHQTQIACLIAHAGNDPWQIAFQRQIASAEMLVASVTSEGGVGGDFRTSRCAMEWEGDGFRLVKVSPVISYGAHSDALLVTARRDAGSDAKDQVLVAIPSTGFTLERQGRWQGMGLRGTDSSPFLLTAHGARPQVLRDGFAQIASHTLLPLSHLLWAAVWLGIAGDVVTRTKRFLRGEQRRGKAMPPGALRLVEAVGIVMTLRARTLELLSRFDEQFESRTFGAQLSDTAAVNLLKLNVSEGCVKVVQTCLQACGFAAYVSSGPFSLSRQLRDLESGPLMVNNDRVRDSTAQLLLAQLPQMGL